MSKKWGNVANWVAIALALATFIAGRVANMPDWYVYVWVALLLVGLLAVARIIFRILRSEPEAESAATAVSARGGDGSANVAGQAVTVDHGVVGHGGTATHVEIEHYHKAPRVPTPHSPLHTLREPVPDFTGREDEIAELTKALTAPDDCNAALISGIRGMGGVGKTELALVVARALAPKYPDAQIMLELQAGDTALPPETLLGQVIAVLAPGAKLPDSLAELQAIYRDVMRGKCGLLLLDNARDGAQVAPLLPPPKGWAVLVTSRSRIHLAGSCLHKNLDVLLPRDAHDFLLKRLQAENRAATEEEIATLAQLCGYLPLALRLATAHLGVHEDDRVEDYLADLKKEGERLKHLKVEEESVQAVLGISVAQLERDASEVARLWRLLAAFPARFDRDAARAVWGDLVTRERDLPKQLKGQARDELKRRLSQRGYLIAALVEDLARFTLSELLRRSLLDWDDAKQEYYLHDLLREYALTPPLPEGWDDARRRHAAHYLEVGAAANALYLEGGENVLEGPRRFDAAWPHLRAAWDWMKGMAGTGEPPARPYDPAAARWLSHFPGRMPYVMDLRMTPRQKIPYLGVAAEAARRLGDKQAEGVHLGNLGTAYAALGDPKKAIGFCEQANTIACDIGDRRNEWVWLGNLGNAYKDLGEPKRAIGFYEQQLGITHEIGDRRGEGAALGSLGLAAAALGEPKRAIGFYEQALVIAREIGDRRDEGTGLSNLGLVYADLGDPKKAIGFYEQALVIAREIGHRHGEGNALGCLAIAYERLGEIDKAIPFYGQALEIAKQIGDRRNEASHAWNLGLLLAKQGDDVRAAVLMQVGVDYLRSIGHPDAEQRAAQVEEVRKKAGRG